MAGQSEGDRPFRFASQRTTESFDIEPFCRRDVVDRKCQMKKNVAHCHRSRTTGCPVPAHQAAAIRGVTWAIANRPCGTKTSVPAAPSIRETSCCNTDLAA